MVIMAVDTIRQRSAITPPMAATNIPPPHMAHKVGTMAEASWKGLKVAANKIKEYHIDRSLNHTLADMS